MPSLRSYVQLPGLVLIAVLGYDVYVSLACTNGDIRLVGGASNLEGRVEICDGNTWGTVCDDYWDAVDANVACGQLGFRRSGSTALINAFFGEGTGPILLDDVQCSGTEAQLVNCPSRGIGRHNCDHAEDAGVICQNCTDGQLRLVDGSNPTEGRVEMCYNAVWGTVCDDLWDSFDASVVCRQLGFSPSGATAIPLAFFGQGNGSIWLDNVECTGNEIQLIACSHNAIGSHNCSHSQDASVRCHTCTNGDIRLVGAVSNLEGRVEICDNATWGTVCDNGWETVDANVACGQLGFRRSDSTARSNAAFGRGTGPILLDNVQCSGTEAQLVNCNSTGIGRHNCDHTEDAGVICQNCTDGELRLVNGSNHTEGRVEMCYNAVWGTVCDHLWDSFDASVVCRQLGFSPTGATAIPLAFFGQGSGSIWLDNVECTGNEIQLIACSHNAIGSHNCSHSQDASVRCQDVSLACTNGDIRLVGGASDLEGRVEICDNNTWGTVCDDSWDTVDANVACGQLGFIRSGSTALINAFFGEGTGPILLDNVRCLGTETQLVNCPSLGIGRHNCQHIEDAGVICQILVVGFERTTYMVNETDEQVELCAIVSVPEDQNIGDVTFSLALETQNGTAVGIADTGDMVGSGTVGFGMTSSGTVGSGADYISVMTTLATFSTMLPKQCFNVTIIDDMEVEISEEFFATLTLIPASLTIVDLNRTTIDPLKATVSIMDNDVRMTPVPSAASASLPGSAIPSPSTSPTSSPVTSAILWPVLFAPLAVVLLVLLIVAVAAIVYCKRRRRFLNLKRGLNREDKSTERLYEANPLARHRPSVQLRRMLPHRMIIPSSVLKLQDSVGQGEFGVVYKAHLQWHLDAATEVVAVKTLKGLFTPNDVDNLVQEVLKMHTLSHPNVMSLTGVCLDAGGGPAVVMPFMGRGSVLHYLKKERGKLVPPDDADCSVISDVQRQLLGMCLQISKGMEYLAKERIVHRDLAARNCMMDTGGVIKVADFGLSEDIYTTTYYQQRKSDTSVKLPVKWMPPESIADGMFTEKSDVWSFGVTCWEVFTGGHIPYSGISPVALLQLLRNAERLNKPMNPACSDEIYAILLDCWKEEPKERPDFSKLVETISLTLEAAAGYMELSLCVKDEHPQVAAEVEVKTTADDYSVQLLSKKEEGGQRETAM